MILENLEIVMAFLLTFYRDLDYPRSIKNPFYRVRLSINYVTDVANIRRKNRSRSHFQNFNVVILDGLLVVLNEQDYLSTPKGYNPIYL